ncbi:MAG: aminopeptidase P N-terminal domain-containing protein, partial [Desulfobacterales bacterium]|nr:aminopeptidase P N-terminal domain-containing protein [Desulfobacterales bacterium]
MRTPPIGPQLFIDNRRRLAGLLKPGWIAVVNSSDLMPRSADGVHPFVQQTDLIYLTGIDQEETVLLLFPDAPEAKHREILFLRETSDAIALWEGRRCTQEEARALSGVATVLWNTEFEALFRALMLQAQGIYLNSNEHPRAKTEVESRDARFLKWCRDAYPLHAYDRLAPLLHRLRAVKSAAEVDLLRRAAAITGQAFRRLLGFIRPGVWEFEIEAEIYHEFLRSRSRGPAFQTIVAAGADACVLHYVRNDKQVQAGDLVLIDFGAEYAHYAGDLTRTVPADGRFTPRQRAVYAAVLRVQKEAVARLRPGGTLDRLNTEAGRVMESELIGLGLLDADAVRSQPAERPLYKKYFPHGISHHLGLDVHDVGDRYRPFEPGMVFTCEPGVYIPEEGIGVRIENDILVTDG